MAQLYFKVGSDWQEVVRLRDEIEKLEKQLLKMDRSKAPGAVAALETQLGSSKQKMTEMVTEAAKAGATMENGFKKKIFEASKVVNDFSQEIIDQKRVIKDIEQDLRNLSAQYRKFQGTPRGNMALTDYNAAKKALQEEKNALFGLTQQQAEARLSVKQLKDEYSLLKGESKDTIDIAGQIEESMSNMGKKILGGIGIKEVVSNIVKVRGEFQLMDTAIETLLGNKEKSDKLLAQVKQYAAVSPLELKDVNAATQMMLGFNIEAEKVPRFISALGDISMGEASKFNSLTLAFSQMSSTGKLMGQDLNQMINAGFNPLSIMAEKTGKSIAQLKKEMSDGAISAEMVQQAFIDATEAGGKFYNMSENASKTINGQISMFNDALDAIYNEIGTKGEGVIIGAIQGATSLVKNYETIGKVLAGLISTYGAYRTALMLAAAATNGWTIATTAQYKWLVLTEKAQKLLNATMLKNPFVLVATVTAGLIATMWALGDSATAAEKAQRKLNDATTRMNESIDTEVSVLNILFDRLRKAKEGTKEFDDAKKSIMDKYGSYLDSMSEDVRLLKDLKTAQDELTKAITETARARSRDKFIEEAASNSSNKQNDALKQIRKIILEEKGNAVGGEIFSDVRDLLRGYDSSETDYNSLYTEILGVLNKNGLSIKELGGHKLTNQIYEYSKAAHELRDAVIDADELAKESPKKEVKQKEEQFVDFNKQLENSKKKVDDLKTSISNLRRGITPTELKPGEQFDFDKAIEDEEKLLQEAEKKLQRLTGTTDKTSKQTNPLPGQQKIQDELIKLSQDNEQQRINLLKNGGEKRRAQIKFNYNKEILLIKQKEDEWKNAQDGELTDDQNKALNEWKQYAAKNAGMELYQVNQDELKKLNDTLEQYQTYYQKRLSAIEKFKKDRENLEEAGATQGQLDEVDYQEKQTLQSIDNEFATREEQFKKWADSVINISLEELNRLLVEAERELERMEFLNPKDNNLAVQRQKVTTLRGAVSNGKNDSTEPSDKSIKKWQNLQRTLHNVEKEFREIGEAVGGTVGEILTAAATISTNTLSMVKSVAMLADKSTETVEKGATRAAMAIQAVEKASVVLAIISAAMQITQKMFDIFGGDNTTEKYEKAKEAYESYISILDSVIEKQLELAESLTGKAATAAYEKAIELIKTQSESARVLGKQYLSSGKAWNSRSKGVYEARDMSSAGWEQAAAVMGMSVQDFKDKMKKGMGGLFELDDEELADLRDNAAIFWSQLDSDTQKYAGQIADGYQEAIDVIEQKMTDITGLDVSSLKDDFLDLLNDMDADSEKFADNFEEYLKKAILNSMIKESFAGKLETWREKFAESMEAGTMDKDYDGLKEEAKELSDAMIAEREALANMYGWNSSSSSQEATKRGFETMSQDTASELNGRFTALQQSGEEILNQNKMQTEYLGSLVDLISDGGNIQIPDLNTPVSLDNRQIMIDSFLSQNNNSGISAQIASLNMEVASMNRSLSEIKGITDELRTIQVSGWDGMMDVSADINKMAKTTPGMADTINTLNKNFKDEFNIR